MSERISLILCNVPIICMMIEYYACEIVVFGLDIKYNTCHIGIMKITIKVSQEIIAYKTPPRTQNHHTHQYGNICSQYHELPVSVAARSKAYFCGRSPAEIVGLNPTGGMDVCPL
jgi:hypothetical protein